MKTEHTPGPWTSDKYGVRNVGGYICSLHWPHHYDGQDARFQQETAEREGDARLIAAAPDMFDELATKAAACNRLRAENAELGRLAFDLAEACRAFLEAQDSPAPRDLLTLAAIKASAALAKAGQ